MRTTGLLTRINMYIITAALEKEIKVFAFDNGVILGKKQKKNFSKEVSGRIPVAQKNVETRKESAWDILDKYVPNK